MKKNTTLVVMLACAPVAAFADCQNVSVDATPHIVCTQPGVPAGGLGFGAAGVAEALRLRQK